MSEELTSHKRKRSVSEGIEEDDHYEPTLATEEDKFIPPHEQQQQQETVNNEAHPQHNNREEGDHDQGFKRQRRGNFLPRVVELAKNIVADICKLGDNPYYLMKDLEYISLPISKELDTADEFRNAILEYLYSMIVEQPHKVFIISALVQVCNAKNPKVGQYIVDFIHFKIQEILDSLKQDKDQEDEDEENNMLIFGSSDCGPWDRLKLMLRFLTTLSPILEEFAIIPIFQQFLEVAIDLQKKSDSEESPLFDLIFYSTVISIPYIVASDRDNKELQEKCNGLIEIAKGYKITKPSEKLTKMYNHYRTYNDEPLPYEPKTLVELVLPAVIALSEGDWEEVSLFPDFRTMVKSLIDPEIITETADATAANGDEEYQETDDFDGTASTKKEKVTIVKHQLPQFNIPSVEILITQINLDKSSGNIDLLFRYPRFIFSIYEDSTQYGFDIVPKYETYTSLILRDVIQDIVQNMEYNKIIVTKQLLNLNKFFNEKLFAKWNSSIDKLTLVNDLNNGVNLLEYIETNQDLTEETKNQLIESAKFVIKERDENYKSTYKMETIIIESIINLMFSLPNSPNPIIYYQSLLVELCERDLMNLKKRSYNNYNNQGQNSNEDKLSVAKVLALGIQSMFGRLKFMDNELVTRFVDLMIIQLNNFKFEWNWDEWKDVLSEIGDLSPVNYFIKNIISKEIRISNPFEIQKTLPLDYHKYLKLNLFSKEKLIEMDKEFFGEELSEKINDSNDNYTIQEIRDGGNADYFQLIDQFLFNNQEHLYHEICHLIYTNIQENESLNDFNKLVIELKQKMEENNESIKFDKYLIILVIQCVCIIGSRSLSVIEEGALELSKLKLCKLLGLPSDTENDEEEIEDNQFKDLNADEVSERQRWLVSGVLRIWNNEPRIAYLILMKIYNKGFITAQQIVGSLITDNEIILSDNYSIDLIDRLINEDETEGDDKLVNYVLEKLIALLNKQEDADGKNRLIDIIKSMIRRQTIGIEEAKSLIESTITDEAAKNEILQCI